MALKFRFEKQITSTVKLGYNEPAKYVRSNWGSL